MPFGCLEEGCSGIALKFWKSDFPAVVSVAFLPKQHANILMLGKELEVMISKACQVEKSCQAGIGLTNGDQGFPR